MLERLSEELSFKYGVQVTPRTLVLLLILIAGTVVSIVLYVATRPPKVTIPKDALMQMQMPLPPQPQP